MLFAADDIADATARSTEPGLPWPTAMAELDIGERLVIWSFRRWVAGWTSRDFRHWERVRMEYDRHMGIAGEQAVARLAMAVDVLRPNARRVIHYHQPCCPCLCADEVSLLVLVGACQRGERSLAASVANWLVKGEAVSSLVSHAQALADAMEDYDLVLPERSARRTLESAGTPVLAAVGAGRRAGVSRLQ